MKLIPFNSSKTMSIGVELELQILDPTNFDLSPKAAEIIKQAVKTSFQNQITPEVTQSMIEINSSVHKNSNSLYTELVLLREFLSLQEKVLDIKFCGGGTHPFQKWQERKIFPGNRFLKRAKEYTYLMKLSTIFGLHIHIGCLNSENALYLCNALLRFIPHFIAISASSPFYQNTNTSYHSARLNNFLGIPDNIIMPYFQNWKTLSEYYFRLKKMEIIKSFKECFWDVRPNIEFGTVEIRVCDMPLSLEKIIHLTEYVQTLSQYLIETRSYQINNYLYEFYSYNRFQASRYGFSGRFIDSNMQSTTIQNDIFKTFAVLNDYSNEFKHSKNMERLYRDVKQKENGATILQNIYKKTASFKEVLTEQCVLWKS